MEGIGKGIGGVFFIIFVFGFGLAFAMSYLLKEDSIKSKKRIEPKIELIINNNQVDTLFVYELQK